jgi:transcriptional regulator with XRE-family HTH domain
MDDIANKLNIHIVEWAYIRRGRKLPTKEQITKLNEIFGVDLFALFPEQTKDLE